MAQDVLTHVDADTVREGICRHLKNALGKDVVHAPTYDWRMSLSLTMRDMVVEPWFATTRETYERDAKRLYYLSMEFLIRRLISDCAINLGIEEMARDALEGLGQAKFDPCIGQIADGAFPGCDKTRYEDQLRENCGVEGVGQDPEANANPMRRQRSMLATQWRLTSVDTLTGLRNLCGLTLRFMVCDPCEIAVLATSKILRRLFGSTTFWD